MYKVVLFSKFQETKAAGKIKKIHKLNEQGIDVDLFILQNRNSKSDTMRMRNINKVIRG